jgi:hypothetical protein
MKPYQPRIVVACLGIVFSIAQAGGAVRDADLAAVADPSLDVGSVAARRMENGRLMFEVSTVAAPRVEQVRIFLDTDPSGGAPETGADFMIEGYRMYRRPARARGWQWDEIESPLSTVEGRRVIYVLPSMPELERGAWFVETVDAQLSTVDRVPEKGAVAYVVAELPAWQPPMRASPADIHDLLDYGQFSLTVRLDTELKSVRWTDLGLPWPAMQWTPVFQDSPVPFKVVLQDCASGESVALDPESVRANEDNILFEGEELGVNWAILIEPAGTGAMRVTGRLEAENDRVLRLEIRTPLDGEGWVWHDDFQSVRRLEAGAVDLANVVSGPFGERSVYPFGVISRDAQVLSVETDPLEPRVFCVLARTEEQALAIQYDLALTQQTSNFPGRATFRCEFRSMQSEKEQPFRAVAADYQRRHPASHAARSSQLDPDGLVHLTPWVQRVPLSAGMARTEENVELLLRLGLMEHGRVADISAATLLGACIGADGKWPVAFDAGAIVPVNVDPDAGATPELPVTRAAAEWNTIRDYLKEPRIAGVRFDAMQVESPDYRGAAIGVADFPCVFEPTVLRPCIANSFSGFEFMTLVSRALAAKGKVIVGSSADVPTPFHVQHVDGVVEEVEWLNTGAFMLEEHDRMIRRRVLAGKRPVAVLLNGPFDTLSPEAGRRAFEEALFWGFVPRFHVDSRSGALHGSNPAWITRDYALVSTYEPLAGRLADAGWEPVGFASVKPETVRIEHFGATQAVRHITIRNEGEWIADAQVVFHDGIKDLVVFNPLNGECSVVEEGFPVRLLPGEIQMLDLFAASDIEQELSFLGAWLGGTGEGTAGQRSLESLKAERAIGVECDLRVPVPSVRDDPNRLEIVVRNKSEKAITLSGLRIIGTVFREAELRSVEIEPDAVSTASVPFLAADIPASGWLEVLWTVKQEDVELVCTRFIRPRVVNSVEFRASPAQVEAGGLETDLQLVAINHSANPKSFTVTWRGDFRGGMQPLELAPFSTQKVGLPIRARRAGQGEVYATVDQGDQRIAVIRFDVRLTGSE